MGTDLATGLTLHRPADDDTGDSFYPALADNIDKLNDHRHKADDSLTVAAANWGSADGNGIYTQTLTVPNSKNFDDVTFEVRDDADDSIVFPELTKASATTFTIKTNDNTLTYSVHVLGAGAPTQT